MIRPIYASLTTANQQALQLSKETGRYWTAIKHRADGWILTDRYHPKSNQEAV